MSFWCLQFLPKYEQKQAILRFHSSKVKFVCSFFGRNVGLKKSFRLCLTFRHYTEKSFCQVKLSTSNIYIMICIVSQCIEKSLFYLRIVAKMFVFVEVTNEFDEWGKRPMFFSLWPPSESHNGAKLFLKEYS